MLMPWFQELCIFSSVVCPSHFGQIVGWRTRPELPLLAFASLWTERYGMSLGIGGFHYLFMGVGFMVRPNMG
jgi:hypothetical protein